MTIMISHSGSATFSFYNAKNCRPVYFILLFFRNIRTEAAILESHEVTFSVHSSRVVLNKAFSI